MDIGGYSLVQGDYRRFIRRCTWQQNLYASLRAAIGGYRVATRQLQGGGSRWPEVAIDDYRWLQKAMRLQVAINGYRSLQVATEWLQVAILQMAIELLQSCCRVAIVAYRLLQLAVGRYMWLQVAGYGLPLSGCTQLQVAIGSYSRHGGLQLAFGGQTRRLQMAMARNQKAIAGFR